MAAITNELAFDLLNQCARHIGQAAYVDSDNVVRRGPQYTKIPSLVHNLVEAAEGRTFTIEQIGDIAAKAVIGFWIKNGDPSMAAYARTTMYSLMGELQKVAFQQRHPIEPLT